MPLKLVAFLLAAAGGVALFAWGGADRIWPLQILGLALVIGCLYAAWRWFAEHNRPPPIKPAANPAWSMRDQPPPAGPGKPEP